MLSNKLGCGHADFSPMARPPVDHINAGVEEKFVSWIWN